MLHTLLIYQFRVRFCTLMFILSNWILSLVFMLTISGPIADIESRAQPSLDPYQKLFVTWLVVIMQRFKLLS